MTEEEIKAKAEELERKEGELLNKEKELNELQSNIDQREADAGSIAQTIKEEYEKKLSKQKEEYENRLKSRDEVIRQLANGEAAEREDENDPFAQLNKRRRLQKAA